MSCWLMSDFLDRQKRFLMNRKTRRNRSFFHKIRRKYLLCRWGVSGVIIVATIGCLSWVNAEMVGYELRSLRGSLIPANDPLPPNSCGEIPEGALVLFLGGVTSYTTRFPHTVIEINDSPRLIIDRDQNANVSVSVDIFGSDGKIIAELKKNEFIVNENNHFKIERRDRSSLSVYDSFKNEVLSVRYLNKKAIWINAILRYPDSGPVILRGPGGGGICAAESGRADIAINAKRP